jgi:hypothetical protein
VPEKRRRFDAEFLEGAVSQGPTGAIRHLINIHVRITMPAVSPLRLPINWHTVTSKAGQVAGGTGEVAGGRRAGLIRVAWVPIACDGADDRTT